MRSSKRVRGVDAAGVTSWFGTNVPGARAPLEFELIAAGRSNLTIKVSDADANAWVLRRPPLGPLLATAHDMDREHRIISALSTRTHLPVPPAVAYCDDEAVTGAPFYVMGFVAGQVIHDVDAARALSEDRRRRAGESLVDALSDLHAVDPEAIGLGDLGRRDGYIERQLRRWHAQLERVKRRDLPLLDELHQSLLERAPAQVETRLVHGDFGLDNGIFDERGILIAILDWEICTLGDPLADLGLLRVRWVDPEDAAFAGSPLPPAAGGFPRWSELAERYALRSGRDLSSLSYYVAYAYWKAATMLEATRARHESGSTAGQTDFKGFGDEYVTYLLETARSTLQGMRG
jgi:aminoglycoside phosphotransferase (APT) family kinase protein